MKTPWPAQARRCPLCQRETRQLTCPEHRITTLLVDAPASNPRSVRAGQLVAGRYELLERIGVGGFAHVFAARQLGTGRTVALKIRTSATGESDETALSRFFREAHITAGLSHPSTVRVMDFGQDDSGLVFLAMELLDGESLGDALERRTAANRVFSEAETAETAIAVARSLCEAHARGLVHRDLKPSNVFLHRMAGGERVVKVLDFGIAKVVDEPTKLTAVDRFPGTPAFMSPEQVRCRPLDGRSDLYSLGIIMYTMLTGGPPFVGKTHLETFYKHVNDPVPDVLAGARTPVGTALERVIRRALAKDPNDRFDDARAMADALAPVANADPGPSFSRRQLILAGTISGLLTAGLTFGFGLVTVEQLRPKKRPKKEPRR